MAQVEGSGTGCSCTGMAVGSHTKLPPPPPPLKPSRQRHYPSSANDDVQFGPFASDNTLAADGGPVTACCRRIPGSALRADRGHDSRSPVVGMVYSTTASGIAEDREIVR